MAVTIDELTAEVVTPDDRAQPAPAAQPSSPPPSERRRQREHFERLQQRACRVLAD